MDPRIPFWLCNFSSARASLHMESVLVFWSRPSWRCPYHIWLREWSAEKYVREGKQWNSQANGWTSSKKCNRSIRTLASSVHTSTVNWLWPLSCQQLVTAQKNDPVLSILDGWTESGILPTREQVTMEIPAVRKYWLYWPQIELRTSLVLH